MSVPLSATVINVFGQFIIGALLCGRERENAVSTAGIIGYVQIYPRGHGTVGEEKRWRSRPFVRVWRERNVMFVGGRERNAT